MGEDRVSAWGFLSRWERAAIKHACTPDDRNHNHTALFHQETGALSLELTAGQRQMDLGNGHATTPQAAHANVLNHSELKYAELDALGGPSALGIPGGLDNENLQQVWICCV